nr:reverse transcriptase domain-containing protein [Tanacetum cinerariifolium]
MADQRTMIELLCAPTEGYAEAIVVPLILAEQFELKYSLINMMTSDQFFGLEKDNPHVHIRWFNKFTSTIKYKDAPNSGIKLMLFPFSLAGAPHRTTNLRNEISNFQQRFDESFHEAWDRYKDLLRACPHHGFTELNQLDTFYNALNPTDQDSLNAAAGGNLLERRTQDVLTIIENKSKCLAAGGNTFLELKDNTQGYVSAAAVQYNQEKVRRMNEANMKAMQTQIDMVKNELRNEMKNSTQTSLANQTNEIKNMMASLLQMNTASTSGSGSLPSNTVANPKGELKAITTRSGLVIDGPTVPTPPKSINPEVDECVEETFTDPDLAEYTIKVPPPFVSKYKPPSQREFIVHQRDPLHPNIPYPSWMLKQKQQQKDEVQIHKFWQMFKQLHINITLADALILMPKYQKMLKALLSNKEKLQELANTPLNENFSTKLGLLELISTRMTLKLANRVICTPAGIARDVFVSVGKFTFPADFVIVDYESDPRVPLILGRPFLRTACALIDVHGEEMILQGGNVLSEKLLDLDFTKDLHPLLHDDTLSGSTIFPSNPLLEEFTDKLAILSKYDDLQFDIESDLKEIEFLLYQDVDSSLKNLIDPADIVVDYVPEMFTDEHALDYSSPSIFDKYDDDFLEIKSDAENVYDDPFDSKGEKIKESKLLIDELDLPYDFLPSEYDSFSSQDFFRVDAFPSTDNEDKIFNPEVPISKMLLPFSSENKEKVFKPGAHTSEKVHSFLISELSHPGYKIFKIN